MYITKTWFQNLMIRVCIYCLIFEFLSICSIKCMQPVPYQVAIRNTKTWRREYMAKGCKRLSMLHLVHLLLWLHQPLVDWPMRQQFFINILLHCCLVSGGWVFSCNGFVAVFLVIFFSVFMGLAPWFDTMLLLLHQWIYGGWNTINPWKMITGGDFVVN